MASQATQSWRFRSWMSLLSFRGNVFVNDRQRLMNLSNPPELALKLTVHPYWVVDHLIDSQRPEQSKQLEQAVAYSIIREVQTEGCRQ